MDLVSSEKPISRCKLEAFEFNQSSTQQVLHCTSPVLFFLLFNDSMAHDKSILAIIDYDEYSDSLYDNVRGFKLFDFRVLGKD